jgi:hypothetical protein
MTMKKTNIFGENENNRDTLFYNSFISFLNGESSFGQDKQKKRHKSSKKNILDKSEACDHRSKRNRSESDAEFEADPESKSGDLGSKKVNRANDCSSQKEEKKKETVVKPLKLKYLEGRKSMPSNLLYQILFYLTSVFYENEQEKNNLSPEIKPQIIPSASCGLKVPAPDMFSASSSVNRHPVLFPLDDSGFPWFGTVFRIAHNMFFPASVCFSLLHPFRPLPLAHHFCAPPRLSLFSFPFDIYAIVDNFTNDESITAPLSFLPLPLTSSLQKFISEAHLDVVSLFSLGSLAIVIRDLLFKSRCIQSDVYDSYSSLVSGSGNDSGGLMAAGALADERAYLQLIFDQNVEIPQFAKLFILWLEAYLLLFLFFKY